MEALGRYILTLTAAAILCGIVTALVREGLPRSAVRVVCGILLSVTALSPLRQLKLPDLSSISRDFRQEGEAAAAMGAELAREQRLEGISEALEAYILDKAASMDAELEAKVWLDGQGNPEKVVLAGCIPPAVRRELEEIITQELGIAKENQLWTE